MRLNRTSFQTPESVRLDFVLAGIGNRALALMIDYTILFLVLIGYVFLSLFLAYQLSELVIRITGDSSQVELWLFAIISLLGFAIYVSYFVVFETLWQGQTPGKRRANIRVIRDDGRPVQLAQAVLRSLARPVDDILYIGAILIMLSRREKRLGDWLAGTLVVQEERPVVSTGIKLSDTAQSFAQDLLREANIAALLPDDFAVVRDYLQRRSFMDATAKSTTSLNLARQVRQVIALHVLPPDTSADLFLEAVYLAYQQQPNQD
jgi:uncharacterized RDD family membrane protein YckC